MQIRETTELFVVADGISGMNLGAICNAIKGGMKLQDVQIFTDRGEAARADLARKRRSKLLEGLLEDFDDKQVLAAFSVVVYDKDGNMLGQRKLR